MNNFIKPLNHAIEQSMKSSTLHVTLYDFHQSTVIISSGVTPSPIEGILTYILDYLEVLNKFRITNYWDLSMVITTDNQGEGTHTWIFLPKPETFEHHFSDDEIKLFLNELSEIFPFDPDVSMGAPSVIYINGTFTVIVPWSC